MFVFNCWRTAELKVRALLWREGGSGRGGGPCAAVPPLWHQPAIVLLSWSIMSSKDWPCPGGRGPITRLITQAWLLLSKVVPGHFSLLLSEGREDQDEEEDGEDDEVEKDHAE